MNFQVTVLKVLVSYPDGFAVMDDIKRDMAILATSGRDWADRTKRLAARVPDLDIFSQGLVYRESGGWKITEKGRAVLEFMEARTALNQPVETAQSETVDAPVPRLPPLAERAKRRRERRERRREGCERARSNASKRRKRVRSNRTHLQAKEESMDEAYAAEPPPREAFRNCNRNEAGVGAQRPHRLASPQP